MNGSRAKGDNKMVRIRPTDKSDVPPSKKARTSPRKGHDQGHSNGGGNTSKANGNGHQPVVDRPNGGEECQLWVDKYKPKTIKQIIGQQGDKSNMRKLINWIQVIAPYLG